MAPSISAAKSWEGFAAQIPSAILAGAVASNVVARLELVEGLGLGLLCGLLGPAGDLSESLFKREIGIKDSGRLLPGHGGLLDRLDAILFCAPAAYLYLLLVLPGA
jgi:phosphatidate cytidylyltransferase